MRRIIVTASVLMLTLFIHARAEDRFILKENPESLENSRIDYSTSSATAISFQLAGFELEQAFADNQDYKKIDVLSSQPDNFGRTNENGLPDLPLCSKTIIIPDQSGVRVNIIRAEYRTIPDIDIAPTQPSEIEGRLEAIPFTRDETAYSTDEFYPAEIVSIGEPAIFRDFRTIQVTVCPFQYNPVTGELRVYSDIDYELIYEGYDSRNVKNRTDNNISEAFLPLYRDYLANFDEVYSTNYTVQRGGYLILATPPCTTKANELAEWKHKKGYDVNISYRSSWNSPSVAKDTIQFYYNNSDPRIEYVLLIGDIGATNYQIEAFTYTYHGRVDVTDHPYSLLEGSDNEPDIIIGRISISSITHLNTIVAKTLGYDKNPDMTDPLYLKRGLAVAGTNASESPRKMALWAKATMYDHGFVLVDTIISGYSNPPNLYRISDAIDDGVALVTYRGWGGTSGWSVPSWHTSDVYALNNEWNIGIMASIVCNTGDFESSECFVEAWLRAGSHSEPKGGVGGYGPTDYYTHTRWNNTVLMGLVSGLLEKGIHNLGSILISAKKHCQEAFPRADYANGWPAYYQLYNTLGDPELPVRTDTPKSMSATYNGAIPVGTNYLDIHVDADGGGQLSGAYVCLLKGHGVSEEVFTGGWTDEYGNITLDFNTATADTMYVTITYRDYIPHQGYCLVTSRATMVAFSSLTIDDDNFGNSSGNGDGNANPTETVELAVQLKNFGTSTAASGVTANLYSLDPSAQVTIGTASYPDIAAGATANSTTKLALHLDGNIPHNEIIECSLSVSTAQGTYDSRVFVPVKSMLFVCTGCSFPGGGANLDPGETASMVINLDNDGELNGISLTGVLSCSDPLIAINDNTAGFGTINAGGSGSNGTDYLSVTAAATAYDGRNVNFTLQLTSSGGVVAVSVINLALGSVDSLDAVGPDNYGYYMYDNIDAAYGDLAPVYNWTDISSPANRISFNAYGSDSLDDASALVGMPFDFVYYGETYTHIIVSINGFIAVDTARTDAPNHYFDKFDNYPIPDPGNARGQISAFWDDLEMTGTANSNVYEYYDSANNKFIIEWSDLRHANTLSAEIFQLIIYDPAHYPTPSGDAEMVFQYYTINNDDGDVSDPDKPESYSSVGFENWAEDDGLQYEYDNVYHPAAARLAGGRAIRITTRVTSPLQAPTLVSPPDDEITDDTTPTLTWTEVPVAIRYHLQVDDNSDFSSPVFEDTSLIDTSFAFGTPLNPGRYYWRVRCSDGSAWSYYSPSWNFIISILQVPVTVSPPNAGTVYDNQPVFVWHSAAGANRYHLQVDNNSNFGSPEIESQNITDTSYQAGSPIVAGTYYWHVRAYDGFVWSNYSGSWSFGTSAPAAPALLAPSNGYVGPTDPPTFFWSRPEGSNSFDIYIDDNDDFSSPLLGAEGFMNTNMTPGSPFGEGVYYWHVRAEGDFGYSSFSPTFMFTIASGGYAYFPGDANMYNGIWPPATIGSDVTYLVNYFRAIPSSQPCLLNDFWCSADANGDCSIIGSDVTRMVNFFRGSGQIEYCADYEPLWHNTGELPPEAPEGWPNCEAITSGTKITPTGSGE